MQLKCKRGYDPEISAAAPKRPEQIGILIGIRFYKFAVRQHHVGREEIIDAQSTFAGEMADSSAKGQSANARRRNNSAGRRHSEHMRSVIDIAPGASAADNDGACCWINTRIFYGA